MKRNKRKWKSYIKEFMMLFLAVFFGSLAEYQLENYVEHQHEKQYIRAMIKDAQTDIVNIDEAFSDNERRMIHLDSLATLCFNYEKSIEEDKNLYRHFANGLQHPAFVTLTERTISQLKNAGGMRLIRNRKAANEITLYDAMAKKLIDQQTFYEQYQNNSIDLGSKLFNYQIYGIGRTSQKIKKTPVSPEDIKLISDDKDVLIEFGNAVILYEGMVEYYSAILIETKDKAKQLIRTLQKEYNIK